MYYSSSGLYYIWFGDYGKLAAVRVPSRYTKTCQ
nr:MAG TPA: hypothetical protein [Caudoviricetes sp.]